MGLAVELHVTGSMELRRNCDALLYDREPFDLTQAIDGLISRLRSNFHYWIGVESVEWRVERFVTDRRPTGYRRSGLRTRQ